MSACMHIVGVCDGSYVVARNWLSSVVTRKIASQQINTRMRVAGQD